MQMVENNQINISDHVFGIRGLLETHPVISTVTIIDTIIYDISVQNLLEHSAARDRSVHYIS